MDPGNRRKRVHFAFYANPVEVLGGDRVEGLRLERTRVEDGRAFGTGEFFEVDCALVIPAIGYYAQPLDGVPFDARRGVTANEDRRSVGGLYAVGWVKRGPTGVIGTNKHDGDAATQQIVADLPLPSSKRGCKTGTRAPQNETRT